MSDKHELEVFLRRWGGLAKIFDDDFHSSASFLQDLKKAGFEDWYAIAKFERSLNDRQQVIWTVSKEVYAKWFYGTRNKSVELIRANTPGLNKVRKWTKNCLPLKLDVDTTLSKFRAEMHRLEISIGDIDLFIMANREQFPPLDQLGDDYSQGGGVPRIPIIPLKSAENSVKSE